VEHTDGTGGIAMMDAIDEISTRMRMTVKEYGKDIFSGAVLVTGYAQFADRTEVCGVVHVWCPSLSVCTLGRVHAKVARFFEDVL
jgi:hypothetical protein